MRDLDFGKELIRKKIPLVSNSPGVYRMLDKKNQVLYVGKAKNLPNRLKSYATDKNQTIRTERMLALTNSLEIVTTSSEAEALLLEANLIKKFTTENNIIFLNSIQTLKNNDEESLWVSAEDPHLNDKAHLLIANFLYEKLLTEFNSL